MWEYVTPVSILLIYRGNMGFLTDFFSNINFETIAQLTMLAMVVISGPIVIVLLALRGGDL